MSLNEGQSHQTSLKPIRSHTVQKDITKPNGEACNINGLLKDASEITWLHSPGARSPSISLLKRTHTDSDEDEVIWKKKKKKTCVSIIPRAKK